MKIKVIFFLLFFLLFFISAQIKESTFQKLNNCLADIRNANYSNGFYRLEKTIVEEESQTNNRDLLLLLHSYYNICFYSLIDDFYNFSYENRYFKHYKQIIEFLKNSSKPNQKDPQFETVNLGLKYFCLGAVKGYRGLYESSFGNLFMAFLYGIDGASSLERSLDYNANNYDAYIGLGLYHYWKAVRASWLPFNEDEKKLGLKQLAEAVAKGRYSRPEALLSYVRALMNENRYLEAKSHLNEYLQNYPESIYGLFLMLKFYYHQKDAVNLFQTFHKIEKSYYKNKYYCSAITWLRFNYQYAYYSTQMEYYDLAKEKINENLKMDKHFKTKGKRYYDYYYRESEKLNRKIAFIEKQNKAKLEQ